MVIQKSEALQSASLRLVLPISTNEDGFIRLRSFPLHQPMPLPSCDSFGLESRAGIIPRPSLLDPDVKLLESMLVLPGDTSPSERRVKVFLHYAPGLHST